MAYHRPTVVIVGRPNVGKSTLFNRIVGKKVAVVEDTPGVTRDRLYADCNWHNKKFELVDTGGILFSDDDPLIEQIRIQAEVAMEEADVILFMVDVETGLATADWDLANSLRGVETPVIVVVNKVDNKTREADIHEFYSLGIGDVMPVSAIHGNGIDELLDVMTEDFKKDMGDDDEVDEIKIALIGRPNVGKSSMLNAFTGESRAIVSDIPGTTRDALDTQISYKGNLYRLIDTAGIRRKGKYQGSIEYYMVIRSQRALERADCAVVLIDGKEGLTDGDKRVAKMSHDLGKPCVFVVNKWDMVEPPDGNLGKSSPIKKDFIREIRDHAPEMSYAPIRFTSALEESGLDGVIKAVRLGVENWSFRLSTGQLNKLIQDAVFDKPLSRKGRAVKVYYTTQAETRPPTFVLFCNNPDLVHFSYLRYLENQIRKEYRLEGTPIKLVARSSREKD